jgi:small-conductance mechanosensitive channel
MQGGGVAGTVEGVVSSLGLLYTTLANGDDSIMVPNSVVLGCAVTPLREPDAVDLKARLRADVRPSQLQDLLERNVTVDVRTSPRISLEEFDGDEVVVRVAATPMRATEGPQLADEILSAVAVVSRVGDGEGDGEDGYRDGDESRPGRSGGA